MRAAGRGPWDNGARRNAMKDREEAIIEITKALKNVGYEIDKIEFTRYSASGNSPAGVINLKIYEKR
jgi:hypothetical protein